MDVRIDDQGGNGIPLTEMWVWVTVHGPGDESITAVNGLPMLAQQERVARMVQPLVEQAAQQGGKPQRLVRMTFAEVVDEVLP